MRSSLPPAVDTDDFVGQLMKGYYDGCQKGANFLPPPSDDIRIGARIFVENCATCHTVSPGGGLKVGPNLCDMAGRPVASQVDFHHYSPGLRPNGAYAADDKEVTHRGYSRGMLKYVLEQGGWGNLTTGGDTLSEDDFVLKPGGSWTLKHGVTAYLNQERTIDLVNPGEDDLLADKLPRWNKSRFCDFVYDPQGTIPGNAMGKKHVRSAAPSRPTAQRRHTQLGPWLHHDCHLIAL